MGIPFSPPGDQADPVYTGTLVWGVNGKFHRETQLEPVRVPGAFPELVESATFDRVQELLKSRAPRVVPPRGSVARIF